MATPKPGKMHSPIEAQAAADKGLKMKIKRTKTGTKHEIVKSGENGEKKRGGSSHARDKKHGEKGSGKETAPPPPLASKDKETPPPPLNSNINTSTNSSAPPSTSESPNSGPSPAPPPLVPQVPPPDPPPPLLPSPSAPSTPLDKEVADACVGTSVGTITEPDCLGPCEPGTSVTLEGIVWHETEGVLVVNVTWRGKTYIGTLLDCTKHEWAPPRFSDSPTADLDVRTPRRGGKRGRNSGTTSLANDLANFTETRSSVYSKLRNSNAAGAKGKRGPGSSSPTPFASPKNDFTPNKRKNKSEGEEPVAKKKPSASTSQAPSSPLPPPVLLECPEPNCSKKYKDVNGLKYHQSHAHGSPCEDEGKEFDSSEEEETSISIDIKKDESTETSGPVDETEESEDKQLLRLAFGTNIIPGSPTPLLPPASSSPSPPLITKVLPFKVKPASALMEDKNPPTLPALPLSNPSNIPPTPKKKNKKSPAGSPHPSPLKSPGAMIHESSVQEGVQSHTYSDISDDDAPLLESEVENKPPTSDELKGQSPQLQPFGMYPYYGQPPYLVPSVSEKAKDNASDKVEGKSQEKEKKEEFHLQKMLSQNYFQDDFPVPGSYQFSMGSSFPDVMDDKKSDKPGPSLEPNRVPSSSINIPSASKLKAPDLNLSKEKHQNENHQIIKESIEMKSQINNSYIFQRQQQQKQSQEDARQFYMYPERKEGPSKATPPPSQQKSHPLPSPRQKDKSDEKKEREDKKQEGVKPTMETQGPPPPSQYAYIHPGYMQTPPYGALPYDPSHPMYRGMNPMLGYPNAPFLHPPLHRYAPEDLSQGQSGKALDLLQHHASQYYGHPSHKIHELQDRALKSPTPKPTSVSATISSPSPSVSVPAPIKSSPSTPAQSKGPLAENKDSRSPPPQRHIHTHHHTHVGLGYPILTGQYPAPFGAEDIRIPSTKYVPPPVVKKE